MSKNSKIIVVFSIPRTGTSHLFDLMTSINNLMVYKEVFHPDAAFGFQDLDGDISEFSKYSGMEFSSIFDFSLRNLLRSNPDKFLEYALNRQYAVGKTLIFKIFPGHLKDDLIVRDILSRNDVSVIIINRRPIDVYISDLKAQMMGAHQKVDTSNITLEVSMEAFIKWWEEKHEWYNKLYSWGDQYNLGYMYLTYENDIFGDNDIILDNFINKCQKFGINLVEGNETRLEKLFKQDLQTSYEKKVSNWKQFLEGIRSAGEMSKLYGYFSKNG